MTKPVAARRKAVEEKIAYALQRYQELMNVLFEAKTATSDPAFLVHLCADIISTARECFDYLAQDIIECQIIPSTTNQKIKQRYMNGKLKAYFPFYDTQITKSGSPFLELAVLNPGLYQALLNFTVNITNDSAIPNSLFTYKLILDVKDMVNEKKHDKLIAVVSNNESEHLVENKWMRMLITPMDGQPGPTHISVEPGTKVQKVAEYRLAFNNEEVGDFCLYSTKATELVINEFYQSYFE